MLFVKIHFIENYTQFPQHLKFANPFCIKNFEIIPKIKSKKQHNDIHIQNIRKLAKSINICIVKMEKQKKKTKKKNF